MKTTHLDQIHLLEFTPHSSFESLFKEDDAQEIWNTLKQRDNVIRAETAVYLGKSPIEALTPELLKLKAFSQDNDKKRVDRLKQLSGAYVRCIMETLGYKIDEDKRHRIKAGTESKPSLFTTSAAYKK